MRTTTTAFARDERGASAALVIILLMMLTIAGVVFVSIFSTGIEVSTLEASSTRALYAAEAGIETAIGRLKKSPVATNWAWNSGYLDKPAGSGAVDVEVLQYEDRDGNTSSPVCEPFVSSIVAGVTNPARTIYVTLAWSSADDLGIELYDNMVADCNDPTASANLIASSLTTEKPESVRYRISAAAPADLPYTVRVTGNPAGNNFVLRISHPDDTENTITPARFTTASTRSAISLGKSDRARREIFSAFSR